MESSTTTPGQATEVPYEQALAEEGKPSPFPRPRPGNIDQPLEEAEAPAPIPAEAEAQKEADNQKKLLSQEELDLLAPRSGAKLWKFGSETLAREYVQRELSVLAKAQWFGLVGEALDKALGGENALTLNSLLAVPEPRQGAQLRPQDFSDADTFVHAVGKLLIHSPEFMEKSICIWLSVPDYEWDLARDLMKQSPEIGGLSEDMFGEMMETFIDQNYRAMDRFFREKFPSLRDRWTARRQEAEASRSQRR